MTFPFPVGWLRGSYITPIRFSTPEIRKTNDTKKLILKSSWSFRELMRRKRPD